MLLALHRHQSLLAKVVLIARSRDRLEKLASELPGAEFLVEDLAAPGAARRVFEAVSARGLLPDLLVNNAEIKRGFHALEYCDGGPAWEWAALVS